MISILKINENATLVFSILNMDYSLADQNFVCIRQFYFTYSIENVFFVLIDCQYVLFKSICLKTSYPIPCNFLHEWFLFFHRDLLAYRMDNIFPSSKYRYVLSISKYSKIKSSEFANNFRTGGIDKLEGCFLSCVWLYAPFRLY